MGNKKRARESRAAIERMYITMRHLFIRGSYKPMGISGQSLMEALHTLRPEIYGDIVHPERVEIQGLLYVLERLPDGIEECRFIKLVAREGYEQAGHAPIVPIKRRRNCYRIDEDRMYVEMTRGRSDIYDILTHLTFLNNEAHKICKHAIDAKDELIDDWFRLEEAVKMEIEGEPIDERTVSVYLSNLLGRTLSETQQAIDVFARSKVKHSLYHITYWLGKIALNDHLLNKDKEITFSAKLRDLVGHHIYGEQWATRIKKTIKDKNWQDRPIHIISANLHSFVNVLYGLSALKDKKYHSLEEMVLETSKEENNALRNKIGEFALSQGMNEIIDNSGAHLNVQLFDLPQDILSALDASPKASIDTPILVVMDYAFGEQAFECIDELLKPLEHEGEQIKFNIRSVSIMGKAGILTGDKGDIMIPTAHVFEGTADNYPLDNGLSLKDFEHSGIPAFEGPMITVLGTSLQNKNVLSYFLTSTWNAIGLEMEGAHYQKAIQAAAKIRNSVRQDIKVYYAYYASDNPLKTGSTLASGSLGKEGIRPTYLITEIILKKILAL